MAINIRVTEVLTQVIKVGAQSVEEAINIVKDNYKQEKIALDESDFHQNFIVEEKEERFGSRKDVLINRVIQYLMKDEKRHYMELNEPDKHIYLTLKELQNKLNE
ncbi:hypothetical protein [uncultured Gammaproteobacteria bacterium]|nr:hypothetical protein [uncultured Gammaproteobacteria bacterium]